MTESHDEPIYVALKLEWGRTPIYDQLIREAEQDILLITKAQYLELLRRARGYSARLAALRGPEPRRPMRISKRAERRRLAKLKKRRASMSGGP